MILTMTEMMNAFGGRYSVLQHENKLWWVMERRWYFNMPNISCVPRDEYTLERHDGNRYHNTWALIGDGVGHYAHEGKPRSACVLHTATLPSQLEGCLTVCLAVNAKGQVSGQADAWGQVSKLFASASGPIKILMNQ